MAAALSTLARPYAKAVFSLAQESGALKEWSARLATLTQALSDPQVAALAAHPALSRSDLAAALAKGIGASLGKEGESLLRLLVSNTRLKALPEIASQFEALRAAAEARVEVEITSAAPVAKPQQDALAAGVKKRLAREVAITWKTDESLIAGALIRAGDLVIDGSVRGELDKLQTALAR